MSEKIAAESPATPRKTLTTWKISVLIIASLTPLSVVVVTLPLGFAFGGPTTALMFLACGVIIGLFCVGYVQMVRRITRPGAFYNYIARGIGRPSGVGAAMLAAVGYPVGLIGTYASCAYTISTTLGSLGIHVSYTWSFVALAAVVGVLTWRRIDISALASGIIVSIELLLILALLVSIVIHKGAGAFQPAVISPSVFHYGDWTVALIFAILSYQGFEAGALYAPEAKRPEKSVPRALYLSLLVPTATFFFTSWILASLSGAAGFSDFVTKHGFVAFIFYEVTEYLGRAGLWLFSIGVILGLTVCSLAVNNFMARYLFGLSHDGLLPRVLSRTNKHGAPSVAAFTLLGISALFGLGSLLVHVDPYMQLTPVSFGIGTLTSTGLQLLASASVIGFFLRRPAADRHWWKTLVAPILATLLLLGALVAELTGFSYVTGVSAAWTNVLPLISLAALIFGVIFGFWLKRNRPTVYTGIAEGDTAEEAAELRQQRLARNAITPATPTEAV